MNRIYYFSKCDQRNKLFFFLEGGIVQVFHVWEQVPD
jgi:hypothetical protein